MSELDLKKRTKAFALEIIKMLDSVPNTVSGRAIANQIVRSATSVAANYRASCRGRSKAEFIAKMGIVIEEADETAFWLEILIDSKLLDTDKSNLLLKEANELVSIFVASIKTAKRNR